MAREQINQMGRNNKVVLHNELKTNQNDVYYRLTSELSSLLKTKHNCFTRWYLMFSNSSISLVPIITNLVSSNPTYCKVYLIQLYVIKFVSDLQQVGVFLWVHRFPPPIKLTATITEILLKVALNIITLTLNFIF
jgi:hypothetical protein